jgi:HD superfamily phosphohydrolase
LFSGLHHEECEGEQLSSFPGCCKGISVLPPVPDQAPAAVQQHYQGLELIADPIHAYIPFTVTRERYGGAPEVAEQDLIDSPWMQRLRTIMQLQSARWVFPAAEHSRFQHSLGAMHVAGRFARQVYPSLREVEPSCPSLPFVEAVLRMSALLHDIGHGPFGHFFDENHLRQFGIGHEAIGARIIVDELGGLLRGMRRSPSGAFASDEVLEPHYIAYLMHKKAPDAACMPRWLRLLRPILGGMYTADNLDYVLRDSYMCGVAIGPVDLDRLIHYSFLTEHGFTLHKVGIGALTMFLTARLYLYTHVYFHRTTRAIDMHLREIFSETMCYLFPGNPLDDLAQYLGLTDWSLLEAVRGWESAAQPGKRVVGREWRTILQRQVKWKMAYDATLPVREFQRQARQTLTPESLVAHIRKALPPTERALVFQLDIATQDPRNINPLPSEQSPICIYEPATGEVRAAPLEVMFEHIPAEVVQYRVYTTDPVASQHLARACETAFAS